MLCELTGREAADLKALIERTSSHRIGALVAIEIGGMNGLLPVGWAAATGLPLVDADGMGRAFPQTAKTSMNLAGVPPTPAAVVDHYGNAAVFENADPATLDALARSVVITLGGLAANTAYLMEAHQARTGLIHGTVSLAMELGRSLNAVESDRIAATIERFGGRELGRGKVLEVERQGTGGIVHGAATVEIADDERLIRIEFQNENLLVLDGGEVAAAVPDVIAVFDTRQGVPIACEALRYGQRVSVLQLPCQGLWRSEAALELAGPGAFGYVTPEALR